MMSFSDPQTSRRLIIRPGCPVARGRDKKGARRARLCDHTTADDASRYRDDAEVSRHWPEEPVLRLRRFLTELGHWTKVDEQQLLRETAAEITAAAGLHLAMPPQDPAIIFDYTFASPPAELATQRQAALGRTGFAVTAKRTSNVTD